MQFSNDPDIAIAQEWLGELEGWLERHGLQGYDPFDVKQHRLIRSTQSIAPLRKATTGLCDLYPLAVRRLLRVPQTENPKAHALTALACLRRFELESEPRFLDQASGHLRWLREHACAGASGLCWGYPFDVRGKGVDSPKGTPVGVVSAIAGQAFLRAYKITQAQEHLDAAHSIAQFILKDLPRMQEQDDTCCFGYTPTDRRRVHNANLLAAEHLLRTGLLAGDAALVNAAEPALTFSLSRQREDGSWPYGEHRDDEPFEVGLMRLVDNHHTGFVLRSLHAIHKARPEDRLHDALRKGFKFYQKLFTKDGMPITQQAKFPVDIHACAEGVLCLSVISESVAGAKAIGLRVLRWTWYNLRDPETGAPYYRRYPWHTARIVFPRWGVAWMYWALAEYLAHFERK